SCWTPSRGLDGQELAGVVALAAVFARDPLVAEAAGAARCAPALDQVGLGGQEHLGERRDPLLGLLGGVVGGLADEGGRAGGVEGDHRGAELVVVAYLGGSGQRVVVPD